MENVNFYIINYMHFYCVHDVHDTLVHDASSYESCTYSFCLCSQEKDVSCIIPFPLTCPYFCGCVPIFNSNDVMHISCDKYMYICSKPQLHC